MIHICRLLRTDTYYNAVGGRELYDAETFAANGIELKFLSSCLLPYPQLKTHEFVPALSILDVLMNNSVRETNDLLNAYALL